MLIADITLTDLFWGMLGFFFLVLWLMILFNIVTDLFRDRSLSGLAKTVWVVALVCVPFLAALVYLLARGSGMAERAMAQQRQAQADFNDYVQSVALQSMSTSATGTGVGPADQIAKAKDLLDGGTIDEVEFERLKVKALTPV